jgi:hypothetical protein
MRALAHLAGRRGELGIANRAAKGELAVLVEAKRSEMMSAAEEADDLVEQLLGCTDDPLRYITLAFPDVTLEEWQCETLEHIGGRLQENARLGRWKAVQIATASGNGIGKSALLSMIILWGITTFADTVGVITAGTEGQLRTRLWPEIAKWHAQLPDGLREQFTLTATALYNKQFEKTWRVDARPWTERNREAFSGVHNYRKRVIVVFDECAMIPDPIWDATSGMLSDAETEIIWAVFGNPTRNSGRFPLLFPPGKFADLWRHKNIDSRDVSLTDKAAIEEKLNFYGRESNYARSHVYGQFPLAGTSQLIPRDVVEMAAVRRDVVAHHADPVIFGVDVASGHATDYSVVAIRQGQDARSCGQYPFPGVNPTDLVYEVAALAAKYSPTTINVDATGVGEGTVSRLRELGYPAQPVYAASRAISSGDVRCANMRAQCWTMMAAWLKVGIIVNDPDLKSQLCAPEYSENAQGLLIEKKDHMRDRGLASPDRADALSLTFAFPVISAAMGELVGAGDYQVQSTYDPFSDAALQGKPLPELTRKYIAPGYPRLKLEWNHPDFSGDDWADAQASDAVAREIWNEPKD